MKVFSRRVLWLGAIGAGGAIALVAWVLSTTVPSRYISTIDFYQRKGFHAVEPTDEIQSMIRRAQVDFLISPTAGRRTLLQFVQAYENPTETNILFRRNSSNIYVAYVFERRSRTPLWKTEIGDDSE